MIILNFRWIRPGTSCPLDPTIFEGEEGQEGRILEGRGLEERFFGEKGEIKEYERIPGRLKNWGEEGEDEGERSCLRRKLRSQGVAEDRED